MDRRGPERTAVSFLASALVHALIALFVFSIATSSSEQSPESVPGGVIMTVSTRPVPSSAPAKPIKVSQPVPHASVVPKPVAAARPRSAPPHPPVRHELAKFAPTAPPNPTPAPVSTSAPNPIPTQAVIAVSPAPLPEHVPTSAPAQNVAVTMRVPPTAAPSPKPSIVPTQTPQTPRPEPSAIAVTAAPIVAMASPIPVATANASSQVKVATPAPQQHGAAPTPGPKAVGSPGPQPQAPAKNVTPARPVQVPSTPHPAARAGAGPKKHPSLNERLHNLIPSAAPSFTPAPPRRYYGVSNILPTPEPEPTPPPDVIASTKFLYVENVGAQRWKQSWLGTAPEERYVKMYVTSVKRIGFVQWCTGWVLRSPIGGNEKWIVEPNESFVCAGHLEPFAPPSPLPTSGP